MIGRLIQKIARQSISISAPPASGPTASAIAETAAQIPSARACSPFREGVADDRQRERQGRRRPHPLHDPAGDQHRRPLGGPGEYRAGAEDDDPDEEDALAAEHVAEPAGGDDQDRDRQQVAVHHPLQRLGAGADVVADARQRQRDDGRVEHQDEEPGAGAGQGPPRPRSLVDPEHAAQAGAPERSRAGSIPQRSPTAPSSSSSGQRSGRSSPSCSGLAPFSAMQPVLSPTARISATSSTVIRCSAGSAASSARFSSIGSAAGPASWIRVGTTHSTAAVGEVPLAGELDRLQLASARRSGSPARASRGRPRSSRRGGTRGGRPAESSIPGSRSPQKRPP